MQTRYCDEISVRLSVRLSVTRVYCDKTVERSVQIYIPYERTFSLVYWEEEWLVGGDPFYLKFWVNRPPLERNRRFSTNKRGKNNIQRLLKTTSAIIHDKRKFCVFEPLWGLGATYDGKHVVEFLLVLI